jgi:hypothetical protein
MTDLSPAAQAIKNAVLALDPDRKTFKWVWSLCRPIAAAALRAAAMQTLLTSEEHEGSTPNDYELGWNAAVAYIQNIATELEGQS